MYTQWRVLYIMNFIPKNTERSLNTDGRGAAKYTKKKKKNTVYCDDS